ncbi:unnamed protein product [Boreogadus saida]
MWPPRVPPVIKAEPQSRPSSIWGAGGEEPPWERHDGGILCAAALGLRPGAVAAAGSGERGEKERFKPRKAKDISWRFGGRPMQSELNPAPSNRPVAASSSTVRSCIKRDIAPRRRPPLGSRLKPNSHTKGLVGLVILNNQSPTPSGVSVMDWKTGNTATVHSG